ncbi:MAG: hypothetical protein ACRYG7_32245 [Janthinobacterium lividum]
MWHSNDAEIGTVGSEEGHIILDLEHTDGARISLEKAASVAPYAITLGIYGKLMHTVFCSDYEEASQKVDGLKRLIEQAMEYVVVGDDSGTERIIDQITDY